MQPVHCVVLIAFASVGSSTALAQAAGAEPVIQLDYTSEAPACADPGSLSDRVAARLGRNIFVPEAPQAAIVRVVPTSTGLLATLTPRSNGVVDDSMTRAFNGATCSDIHDVLAAAIAVHFEPRQRIAATAQLPGIDSRTTPLLGPRLLTVRARSEAQFSLLRLAGGSVSHGSVGGRSLTLYTMQYEDLGTVPSEFQLQPGTHTFAFGGAHFATNISEDSEMRIKHESRELWRVLGWIGMGVGFGVGLTGTMLAITTPYGESVDPAVVAMAVGGYALMIPGFIGVLFGDHAEAELLPLRP